MTINEKDIKAILEKMPPKTKKNRRKHIFIKDSSTAQEIEANTRTMPGIISQRACAFAGCKGVVVGPIKDMVHIVHGPIGCAFYTWGVRRSKAKSKDPAKNFLNYSFCTDMQESDIVFGGEKKLAQMIDELVEIFKPEAITICATCPVGLIGDDLGAVAKKAEEKHSIQVLHFNCEGYKGVSQSAGHHIANNVFMEKVIGTGPLTEAPGQYSVNLLGDYNIGGDAWEIERIIKEIGYTLVTTMTGDCSYKDLKNAHVADLNLVQCHRSINYIAEMLETKYGIPWLKTNFIGVEATIQTLRNMARIFGDEALIRKTEEVIAREVAEISPTLEKLRKICTGKTAFCLVGGSRAHHYQDLFAELGIETVAAGYEFGHRDDYEGRKVIPFIKSDADSKNIPDLHVESHPTQYRLRMSPEKYAELKEKIPALGNYAGMLPDMKDGHVIVDDYGHHECEELIKLMKPDIFASGVKDKYISHKMAVPSKQLHSYDYSGPYTGFRGAVIFAGDVANMLTCPGWKMITPPWKDKPLLEGTVRTDA
ncbi:MAG: Nitrogenase molybdenum-iron protein alpha chain [Syntrophomonadaceae bacterium]|nr:Nitrogenase molybdenum-iron protein alpha chain [Bacillota bacterium]